MKRYVVLTILIIFVANTTMLFAEEEKTKKKEKQLTVEELYLKNIEFQILKEKKGTALLFIPENFSSAISQNMPGIIHIYWIMRGAGIMDGISSGAVEGIIYSINQKISEELIKGKNASFVLSPGWSHSAGWYRSCSSPLSELVQGRMQSLEYPKPPYRGPAFRGGRQELLSGRRPGAGSHHTACKPEGAASGRALSRRGDSRLCDREAPRFRRKARALSPGDHRSYGNNGELRDLG